TAHTRRAVAALARTHAVSGLRAGSGPGFPLFRIPNPESRVPSPRPMRQAHFVARHEREGEEFARWLDKRADSPRSARAERGWQGLRDEDMPARYRRLCQQLALARRRSYSPVVTARLQELMQRGHNALYRPAPPRWRRVLEFLVAGFPRLVRAQRGCLWASAVLFVLSTVAMYAAVRWRPELVHSLFDPQQLASFESMYDPAAPDARLGRDS